MRVSNAHTPGCMLCYMWERGDITTGARHRMSIIHVPQNPGNSRLVLEFELEEVVGYLGSTLPREHEHLIPAHSHREVAAGWGDLPTLGHLQ